MNTKVTKELIERQMGAKGFSSNAAPLKRLTDPLQDTPMVVTLDQLRSYEHNPRKTRNPLYDEIKASIKARGLDQPPLITRRPDEDQYIIRNGGNTRLEILNELWRETKEEQFFRIHCLFKPWQSEINALAGHLAENELHGQLSFIDKAQGIAQIKTMYEEHGSEQLSLRKLSDRLRQDGYPVAISLLSNMLECVNSILPALPNTLMQGLGRAQVAKLIVLKNNLTKVWDKYDDSGSDFFEFWLMVLAAHDTGVDSYNYEVIQDELIGQMSAMLGQSYNILELDLAVASEGIVNKNPLSVEQLASIAQNPPRPVESDTEHHDVEDTATQVVSPTQEETPVASSATHTRELVTQAARSSQSIPEAEPKSQSDKDIDPEAFIDGHIVTPSQESDTILRTRQQVAMHNGDQLPDFKESVLTSIPVTAGGPSSSVSDVWYIETRIKDPLSLRHNIWLLVKDICSTTGVTGFGATKEGLGFGLFGKLGTDGTPISQGVQLMLLSILRTTDSFSEKAPIPLSSALFSQILIGGYDITVGLNGPADVGLARLEDAELVKLFRIIRLARVLVDLEKELVEQSDEEQNHE
ncbi:MAG: ParB N-terminal domain-containing protein [Pseudomonas sp.]|nr:ParB N-terminal domain-containing protein [Pseudomonas sp.]